MQTVLAHQVAIVTGAGGGRGSAIARALAKAGARVAVNDINPDRAERAAAAIRGDGYEAMAMTADVANKFQCVNLIESVRDQWGRLDILVNNASVRPDAPVLKMDEWAWQRCLDVNLKGAFFMSQLVGRVMADENQERGGVIINLGATPDFAASGFAAFSASKAGLVAFSRACAMEFEPYGIRVVILESDGKDSDSTAVQALARTVLEICTQESG